MIGNMIGEIVKGRYHIEELLGSGGMAVVFRATDLNLEREVALKVLADHENSIDPNEIARKIGRFRLEARALAQLHHDNIVEIYDSDYDEHTKSYFIVMELITGPTLEEFIESIHPTRLPEIGFAMVACICDAIEHAHNNNVIHRDIKPSNIMISNNGTIKLLDFGLARLLDSSSSGSSRIIGTPPNMAPENFKGHYSFWSDIYALGTVLYHVCVNHSAFPKEKPPAEVMCMILEQSYQRPANYTDALSKSCEDVILKAMSKDPSDRYRSVSLFRDALVEQLRLVGMENYVVETKHYFEDPIRYEKQAIPQIIDQYLIVARKSCEIHEIHAATVALNHILALDHSNAEAKALLNTLPVKRRLPDWLKFSLIITLLVVLIGVGCYVLWRVWPSDSELSPDTQGMTLSGPVVANHEPLSGPVVHTVRSDKAAPANKATPVNDVVAPKPPAWFAPTGGQTGRVTANNPVGDGLADVNTQTEPQNTGRTQKTDSDADSPALKSTLDSAKNSSDSAKNSQKKAPQPSTDVKPVDKVEIDSQPVAEQPVPLSMTQNIVPATGTVAIQGTTRTGESVRTSFAYEHGNIAYQLLPGQYAITVSSDGFVDATLQITVEDGDAGRRLPSLELASLNTLVLDKISLTQRIFPESGKIRVTGTSLDKEVVNLDADYTQGKFQLSLKPGAYTLFVTSGEFESFSKTIKIGPSDAGKDLPPITLAWKPAHLRVETSRADQYDYFAMIGKKKIELNTKTNNTIRWNDIPGGYAYNKTISIAVYEVKKGAKFVPAELTPKTLTVRSDYQYTVSF